MRYVECVACGYKEEVNKQFFLKVLGGTFVGGGFWAWVSYLFAGTGLARPICIAIVASGVGLLIFSDEITQWLAERYDCPDCGKNTWRLVKE